MFAIFGTDVDTTFGYIDTFIAPPLLVGVVSILGLLAALLWRARPSGPTRSRPLMFACVFLPSAVMAGATMQGHSNEFLVVSSALHFGSVMREYRAVATSRRASGAIVDARLERPADELHVVVIGESTNRNHMQLYGYARETSPHLSALRDELIIFSDVISHHSHTPQSLQVALTLADGDNGLDYVDEGAFSLPELFRGAGLETYWLSNQRSFGRFNNHVAVIAEGADHVDFVWRGTNRQPFDQFLLPRFKALLEERADQGIIFVHLIGTHWPYDERHPRRFRQFDGDLSPALIGDRVLEAETVDDVNSYDNAVLYNDFIVSQLIGLLQRHGPPVSSLLYVSDHGESVFEATGHDSSLFSPGHVEVPLLLWLSDGFDQRHPALVEALKKNRHEPFMIDQLEDLVLDIVGVTTPMLEHRQSPARPDFRGPAQRQLLNGLVYEHHPDPIIAARQQLRILREERPELVPKIWVHRVNSLGKLAQAAPLFAGIELDLVFDPATSRFEVRHPPVESTGLVLEEVLTTLDRGALDTRLWLDLKNLTTSNAPAVLTRLLELDDRFGLKKKAIIETGHTGKGVSQIARAGFYVSYYLPTKEIAQALQANDREQLKELEDRVSATVRRHEARAISFAHGVRGFVEKYLASLSEELDLDHLTWALGLKPSSDEFASRLTPITFGNPRLKVVLVTLPSKFDI